MIVSLDSVWEWYEHARDSIAAALSSVEEGTGAMPRGLSFSLLPPVKALECLRRAHSDLDDLAVLALFAAFERSVLDHLCSVAIEAGRDVPTPLEGALVAKGLEDVDRWYLGDILDVYKAVVARDAVGDVKQVKEYRDWVAHGRRKSPPPGRETLQLPSVPMKPRWAYDRLRRFLARLQPSAGESVPS